MEREGRLPKMTGGPRRVRHSKVPAIADKIQFAASNERLDGFGRHTGGASDFTDREYFVAGTRRHCGKWIKAKGLPRFDRVFSRISDWKPNECPFKRSSCPLRRMGIPPF
jgi:hypothetical protein